MFSLLFPGSIASEMMSIAAIASGGVVAALQSAGAAAGGAVIGGAGAAAGIAAGTDGLQSGPGNECSDISPQHKDDAKQAYGPPNQQPKSSISNSSSNRSSSSNGQ